LFLHIPKSRKITNPVREGYINLLASTFSSSSSSSSFSSQHKPNILPDPSTFDLNQFHPLMYSIEDVDSLDVRVDANIMRGGRLETHALTALEAEFFAEQKEKFEILHNKIPRDQYRMI
jgi:hypothetical protein